MNQPYSSPPANLRSLRDRLTQAARRQGVVFGRLQRHVAMIVVAQLAAMPPSGRGHRMWPRCRTGHRFTGGRWRGWIISNSLRQRKRLPMRCGGLWSGYTGRRKPDCRCRALQLM